MSVNKGLYKGVGARPGSSAKNRRFKQTTYMITGTVANATLPVFTVRLAPGQGRALHEVDSILTAGTCTVAVNRNGTAVPGLGAISVSTTNSLSFLTGGDQPLNDGDTLSITISSVSSASNLSVTITESETF